MYPYEDDRRFYRSDGDFYSSPHRYTDSFYYDRYTPIPSENFAGRTGDSRYRSTSNLDMYYRPRSRVEDRYMRSFYDELSPSYAPQEIDYEDRFTPLPRREEYRPASRFTVDRYGADNESYVYEDVSRSPAKSNPDRYREISPAKSNPDRYRDGYDYQAFNRNDTVQRYEPERREFDARYPVERNNIDDRRYSQDNLDQPGRVRFDSELQYRADIKRRSSGVDSENLPRRGSGQAKFENSIDAYKLPASELQKPRKETYSIVERAYNESANKPAPMTSDVDDRQSSRSLPRNETQDSRRNSNRDENQVPVRNAEYSEEHGSRSSSRRESETGKPGTRLEFDSAMQQRSRRDRGSQQSLTRRESESQQSFTRRESGSHQSISRRDSESLSLSRRDSEGRQESLSRRGSERDEKSMMRRESDKSDKSVDSKREDQRSDEPKELEVPMRSRSRSRSPKEFETIAEENDDLKDRVSNAVSSKKVEIKLGNPTRKGGQYGSQFGSDRMPPPIPPFAEPRSNYPVSKSYVVGDDERSSIRSRDLAVRTTYGIMRRRYYERAADPSQNPTWLDRGATSDSTYNLSHVSGDVVQVENMDFCCSRNAKMHKTSDYELVNDIEQPTPVLRRGQTFFVNINFQDREFNEVRDNVYLNFYFGPNPSVPKRTRVVLPIISGGEFQRGPYQWDARIVQQDGQRVSVEVNVPTSCPVGMWRCLVETSTKEDPASRMQYRSPDDIYIIFNPFDKEDAVYMGNDEQRKEYVMHDCGKIYTGGYRNVRGRPWIFGQFDDCVLPAACVLLEMSGLSHAERGNPAKVTKALTSMIKSTRFGNQVGSFDNFACGLIEAKFEEGYCGGNSPNLWTGSVQIIEEFLKRGASPVKYGQCWVMAGLMTSLCRALGLPSRPVTGFVSALDTQDTLTIDRYIDRFGDIEENGPNCDQPDSVWCFHAWCDVWMHRPDQPDEYSGWQATDPCKAFRNYRDRSSGPCPVEALRRGDVGQRDDVDAFYSSLNAYVRYFYEDEESGWGYSPFRQFRYPVGRYVLTKAVGRFDNERDDDYFDLTSDYRDVERPESENFANFNSCRGLCKEMPAFEYQAAAYNWMEFDPKDSDHRNFDVSFELEAPEKVMIGGVLTIPVVIENVSDETRTIQSNICTRASCYTGNVGPYIKRASTQLNLASGHRETISLTLDPCDYENKVVGMSYVKITVTGFVQETGQSFVDEFDFRFDKPVMKIETTDFKSGEEGEATFSFVNPLDVALTDCFLTMEISGSVRPRTVRISREVRPREMFQLTHSFVTRMAGERRMVASFTSRQLTDVVGHRPVHILGN